MDPALRTFAITSTILALHLIVLALYTGSIRIRRQVYPKPGATEEQDIERVKRAHMNAIENLVPFAIVGGLYVTAAHPSATAAAIYLWTFTAARLLHSAVYLAQKQPHRTILFTIGVLCTFGMGFHVLRALF
jgi:glutathione S-transferase